MQKRVLGKTGLRVTPFCLGAMMFGEVGNTDHGDCVRIIHRALDAGINFIDTADVYSRGESETIVGKALKGRRDEIILASKFFGPMDEDPNHRGGSRRWIVSEVEASLRRLGTDYLDLYQMHRYDENTDMEEVLFTLTELVRQGKVRYFGSSMFPPDRIIECQWIAEKRGLMRFRCEQPWYSIFARDIERFVLPSCHRYGMGAIIWSPLDGGFLAGKYRKTADLTEDSRVGKFTKRITGSFDPEDAVFQRKLALVDELDALAGEAGLPLAQMSVAFTLQHPYVTSAIIGPRTMEHLEGVLPAAEMKLDAAVLDRIDAIVPPGTSVNPITDMPDGPAQRHQR